MSDEKTMTVEEAWAEYDRLAMIDYNLWEDHNDASGEKAADDALAVAQAIGPRPGEPRDTLPADAPVVCSVCGVPVSLGDALDVHRETDGPLYCEPCHDKEYPS